MNVKISIRALLAHGHTPVRGELDDLNRLVELRTLDVSADELLCLLPHTATLSTREVRFIAAKLSVFCARKMLPYFERGYPHDDRARRLLESAELWLTNSTPISAFALIWCGKWRPIQGGNEEWSLPGNAMQAIVDAALCCGSVSGKAACASARSVLWLSSWHTPTGWSGEDVEYREYLRSLL